MLRKLELLVPSFIAATLMLGISSPAFADVLPPEDREDPPETKPKLYEPPPEEPKAEEPKAEAKTEEPKADAKKAEDKSSGCSIDDSDDRNVLGLAALVLVISGVALRRRRSPKHG